MPVTIANEPLTGRAALLLKALTHSLRFRIMIVLTDQEASPKELSEILAEDFKRVYKQVKLLERDGFVEVVDVDKRFGGTQHFFRAKARPFVSTRDNEGIAVRYRQEQSAAVIQAMILDVVRSVEAGTMDSRVDRVLIRMPLILDDQGFKEADDSAIRHMEELKDIQARSAERRLISGDPGRNAASATSIFPMPETAN